MSEVVYITVDSSTPIRVDAISQTPDWIHPHLIESVDPIKGRQFRVSGLVPKGTRLLVDRPYAVIPVVDEPESNDDLLCSNPACNRRAIRQLGRLPCPKACIPDVAWCSNTCQSTDQYRHEFECTWLKRYAGPIRTKRGEYDFGMMWLIVRLLATRHAEMRNSPASVGNIAALKAQQWKHGWAAIDSLCGSADTWAHDQVRSWTLLVKKYLKHSLVLPHGLDTERILHLICQEEANSFGLYPRETGALQSPNPPVDRGEQFAAAVYPTASIANHSCVPNIVHKPDEMGRMVFVASHDIFPGEECCISYFDLTRFADRDSRREHLRKSFKFPCQCEKCVSEELTKETTTLDEMPSIDEL
ncbi:hypothetical protein N7481_012457 [Penicillium waksmanii]|uniref:uncharacterized protein n=1 Tax=Penicillium waksmanii TaxID=69791 RepID=UPI002548CBE5|nr:uncharacterized protein N7481_012457 [Penicillium waksmanii]KAJ5965743.1 hypothetical protein N7481_012457 [Penicillium waksmanii]